MKKNAKLAPSQTPLRQVAIFLHNADFPSLRVTKPPSNSPTERCCFALGIGRLYVNCRDFMFSDGVFFDNMGGENCGDLFRYFIYKRITVGRHFGIKERDYDE